jgi:hypothetical protein
MSELGTDAHSAIVIADVQLWCMVCGEIHKTVFTGKREPSWRCWGTERTELSGERSMSP